MHVIKRGAEAVLYLEEREGKKVLVKDRIKKGYRLPELDKKIRSSRTKREDKLLTTAQRAGVSTPRVFSLEKTRLVMEFLDGSTVKDTLNTLEKSKRMRVYRLIGESVANLHRNGVVHGDLTTSNMILSLPLHSDKRHLSSHHNQRDEILRDDKLYLIDFGMGKMSNRIEDQAVDLYLLREAVLSTHFKHLDEAWENIINVYKQNYSNSTSVLRRFEKIESRRRYKHH